MILTFLDTACTKQYYGLCGKVAEQSRPFPTEHFVVHDQPINAL